MKISLIALIIAWLIAPASLAQANAPDQARAHTLYSQLRCMVCDGQSLAESNSELAQAMRASVREQIIQGKSDSEILDFFAQRYGDGVLAKPPLQHATIVLWIAPWLVILAGAALLRKLMRR